MKYIIETVDDADSAVTIIRIDDGPERVCEKSEIEWNRETGDKFRNVVDIHLEF